MKALVCVALLAAGVAAQASAWAQCGGQGWTGATTCVSGYTCVASNQYYSQCVPSSNAPPPQTTTTRTTTTTGGSAPGPTGGGGTPVSPTPGRFVWYGTNVAGAEFGENTLPGQYGKHFTFPDPAAISTLRAQGYNTFRIQFRMERLTPNSMTGAYNQGYLQNLTRAVEQVTSSGGWAILDPHNYGRFNNAVITDRAAFRTFFQNLATQFRSNSRVIFDTNNEYHTMDQALVLALNQAAIDGIRAAGATQWIMAEGNQWSGAWSWPDVNDNMKNLVDPQNRLVYQMHQYLDSDHSGTSPNCVSSTIGRERLVAATNWLRQNRKVGFLGEFAGGANPTCRTAVQGMLDYLRQNNDVWWGFLWWAAGPWWGDYMFNFEPPSGTGYTYYNDLLRGYIP